MQTKIFCRTTAKGVQSFFVAVNGKEYFLFQQAFRQSNKAFFERGVFMQEKRDYSKIRSQSVLRTLDKLPAYLRYAEKEFGINVYNKKNAKKQNMRRNARGAA